jgi:hypothetical protein
MKTAMRTSSVRDLSTHAIGNYSDIELGEYSTHALSEQPSPYPISPSLGCRYDPPMPSLADPWHVNTCDFQSTEIRELREIRQIIQNTIAAWTFLDDFIQGAEGHESAPREASSYTDENAKHPPMKRYYLDVKVRVAPESMRKRRVYTDEDHQVWRK